MSRPPPAPTAPDSGSLSLTCQLTEPVSRSIATTRPLASAAYKVSPSTVGFSLLNRSPWPTPILRFQLRSSCTSASNFSNSAGGSSFLPEPLQPASNRAASPATRVRDISFKRLPPPGRPVSVAAADARADRRWRQAQPDMPDEHLPLVRGSTAD